MDTLSITGGQTLSGQVRVSGSNNAAFPIIAATLLVSGPCNLENVLRISDNSNLCQIVEHIDVELESSANNLHINAKGSSEVRVCLPLARALRGSILLLGALFQYESLLHK